MKKRSSYGLIFGITLLALAGIVSSPAQTVAQGAFPPTGQTPGLPGFPGGPEYTPGDGTSGTTAIPGVGGTPFPGAGGGSTTITTTTRTSGYCANVNGTILASGSNFGDVVKFFTCFIQNSIIPLLFMLALAVFIWGMVKFISAQQSAEKEDGKQFMLWGVIALAVMFSVWGLVKIFQDTFQVKNAIPQLTVPK